MDGIKLNPVALQTLPPATKSRQAPVLPKPAPTKEPVKVKQAEVDVVAAEQKRYEAVRQASADVYVVSDSTFSLFKDSTGQYITRFTSLRDGKVTYIPEPNILKASGSSSGTQALSIKV